jgi:hypothetical protein
LITNEYESSLCGDFALFTASRANTCIGSAFSSYKYTTSSNKFQTWSNGDCSGKPDFSYIYPIGACLGDGRRLADVEITDPVVATAKLGVGTSISATGEVSGGSSDDDDGKDDDSTCFVENSLVQLKNGTSIPIQFAQVGDEILSLTYGGEFVYSPVVAFPHPLNNKLQAKVITLTTTDGQEESSLTLSRDHLLPVCAEDDCSACGTALLSPFSLVASQEVQPNMCLLTSGADASQWTKVTSASSHSTPSKGMYTVVTVAPYPVVDGIVASPFGTSHLLPSLYYSLHASCYRLGLLDLPAVKTGLDLMNQQMTALLSQRSVREAVQYFNSKELFSL